MAYSEQVLHRARARLEQAKAEREQENAAHRADAYARYPRLAEIDNELRRTMAELMAAALQRGEDPSQAVAAVREKNLALQRERSWILEAGDFDDGYLDDTPVCAKCGGRGYVGAQMCSCLRELCRQEQKKELTSVVYDTAIHLFSDFEAEKFGMSQEENRGLSQRYLQCDLLIIDDLGTEMTTQFVCSALYHVVNTRLMESRPTIISTNLTPEQLSVRYSPQIASRLLGTYRLIQFVGQDIRRL